MLSALTVTSAAKVKLSPLVHPGTTQSAWTILREVIAILVLMVMNAQLAQQSNVQQVSMHLAKLTTVPRVHLDITALMRAPVRQLFALVERSRTNKLLHA